MEISRPDDDIEQHLEVLRPLHEWAGKLVENLRRCRKVGYDESGLLELEQAHSQVLESVYARNGWEKPERL